MGDSWDEKAVFVRALEVPPSERDAFLDSACPTPTARARIAALLSHHAAGSDLLARTPHASGAVAPGVSGASGAVSPSRIDDFEIVRELGRGGMGVVYLARDRELGRLAAVKVLAPHLIDSEQAKERLRSEARAIAKLSHPGIVPIYRAGVAEGRHYIAMEYVPGQTLNERLRAGGGAAADSDTSTPTGELPAVLRDPDAVREAARIVAEVADALDHAHRHEVFHRDIKPSNVIVDSNGRPHLTDFGIAKFEGSLALTTTGDMAGTLPYMSPEQTEENRRVDGRSDLFSLGVVLYELLSLRRPFDGPSQPKLIEAIQRHEPPELRKANRLVPPDLSTICHKALEKRPQNRYQSAAHMAADLRAFLAGDPILARPPSAVRRVRRWVRRHPSGLAAAVVVGSISLAAIGVVSAVLVGRWRLCTVEVVGGAEGMTVQLRPVDENSSLGEAIELGATPTSAQVPAGIYRMVMNHRGGVRVDSTVPLVRPGEHRRIELPSSAPPAPEPDEDMVFIAGGECQVGHSERENDPGPQRTRRVVLDPFFIDRREVSVGDYRRYLEATGEPMPTAWTMMNADQLRDEWPVAGVTWEEAERYARWVGKRLPTAEEWECAMRAPDGRLVPWGDAEVDYPHASLEDVRAPKQSALADISIYAKLAQPVDSRPDLATELGILHASSNVAEYTATFQRQLGWVLIKGASWLDDPMQTHLGKVTYRPFETVGDRERIVPAWAMNVGFRCARSAPP